MKILLLGVGMQGRAALHDLAGDPDVESVLAADIQRGAVTEFVDGREWAGKVTCETFDAGDGAEIDRLMRSGAEVCVDLLPVPFHGNVMRSAVRHGVSLVHASYAGEEAQELAAEAEASDVAILPAFGMDPGIDLVLLGEALRSFDSPERVVSYGAGFPERGAAINPIRYKTTWNLEGTLRSYHRPARRIRNGRTDTIGADELFSIRNIHEIEIDGVGMLEAFANGDVTALLDEAGVDRSNIREAGRFVLRWPGHAAFWKAWSDLHLLDDEPVMVDGAPVDRKRFLAAAIGPHIRYAAGERDIVVVRVDVTGRNEGRWRRVVFQVIDRRDRETGFTAMSRTVGFTAAIGARMIARRTIRKRGLLSPLRDVPFEPFIRELRRRKISVTCERDAEAEVED